MTTAVLQKTCADCLVEKPASDFYTQKGHLYDKMSYCKKCFNKRCQHRWMQTKIKAIYYKGGQCEDCQLKISDSHYAVFEFHHLNSSDKDVDWTKLRLRSWSNIVKELDKCALLCANCHRIRHAVALGFPEQPKSQ